MQSYILLTRIIPVKYKQHFHILKFVLQKNIKI